MIKHEDVKSIHSEIVSHGEYMEVAWCTLHNETSLVRQSHAMLAKRVAVLEQDSSMVQVLTGPLRWKGAKLPSRLRTTCKTHKMPVGHRPLHTTPQYMLLGLSTWLSAQLVEFLNQECYSHILQQSSQLVDKVKDFSCDDFFYFVKADVKDFYMCGKP